MNFRQQVSESIGTIRNENEVIFAECVFGPEAAIFAGHFPGNPIAPGIALLQVVRTVVEKFRREKLNVTAIETAKFLREVRPAEGLTIMLRVSDLGDGKLRVNASGSIGGEPAFKAVLILRCCESL